MMALNMKDDKTLVKDMSSLSLSSIWTRNENSRASTISLLESKYNVHYLPKKISKNQILENQERESKRLEFLCAKNAADISLGSSRLSFNLAMATVPKLILRNAKQLKIVEEVIKPYQDNAILAQYMIDKYITKDKIKNHEKEKENDDDDDDNDDEGNINSFFVTDTNDEDDLEAEFRYLAMEREKIEKLVKQRIKKDKLAERLLMLQEWSSFKDNGNNEEPLDHLDITEEEEDLDNENQMDNNNILEIAPIQEDIISDQIDASVLMKTEKDFKTKQEYIVYKKQMILSTKEENIYKSLVHKQKEIEERLLRLKQKFGEKARIRLKKWMGLIFYFKYVLRISKRYQIVSEREKIRMKYARALATILRVYRKYKIRKWKRENNIADKYGGTLFDKYRNDVELRTKAKAILHARMGALSLISSFIRLLDKSLKHAVIKFLQRIRTLQYFIRCHALGTQGRYIGFNHVFDIFFHRLQMMIFCHIEGNNVYINSQKKQLLSKLKTYLAAPSKKNIIKEMKSTFFFEKLKRAMEGQDMSMILTLTFKFTETIKRKYFLDYIFEARRKYVHKLEQDAKQKLSIQTLTTDEVKMWIKNKRDDPLEKHLNDYLGKAELGWGQEHSTIKINPHISFLKNITANDLLELFFEMFEDQRAIYKTEEMLRRTSGNNSSISVERKSLFSNANNLLKNSFSEDKRRLSAINKNDRQSILVTQPKNPIPSSNSPRKSFVAKDQKSLLNLS